MFFRALWARGEDDDDEDEEEEDDEDEEDESNEEDAGAEVERAAAERPDLRGERTAGRKVFRLHEELSTFSNFFFWNVNLSFDLSMLILLFLSSIVYACKICAPASKFIRAASS